MCSAQRESLTFALVVAGVEVGPGDAVRRPVTRSRVLIAARAVSAGQPRPLVAVPVHYNGQRRFSILES